LFCTGPAAINIKDLNTYDYNLQLQPSNFDDRTASLKIKTAANTFTDKLGSWVSLQSSVPGLDRNGPITVITHKAPLHFHRICYCGQNGRVSANNQRRFEGRFHIQWSEIIHSNLQVPKFPGFPGFPDYSD
jgi:hypothetical protein